jgi:hypothetical protein
MTIIKKKTWPEQFEAMMNGSKTFDVRIADFEINLGDPILFEEFDPKTQEYTGRSLEKRVGYILKTKEMKFWDEKDIAENGFQIMSLE